MDSNFTMEKLYIIKIGGNIVDNPTLLTECLTAFSKLQGQAILVHGGGKLATEMANSMGVAQTMVEGRRITDAATLKIVTMVYAGYINKNIIAQLQGLGVNAMGLTGVDGNLITAHQRTDSNIDYGFVGDVDRVNVQLVQQLLASQLKLVVAPITHNGGGQLLNTNADTIAQSLATGMAKHYEVHLIYGFEREGVLANVNDPSSVIAFIDRPVYGTLKDQKVIFEGMIPKIDNAYLALEGGVQSVIIGKAEKMNELINGTAGTTIKI
ncbi:MAG: acetylglutamate kinase [Bacteroidota bacterium]|jgi:acetylglutamate kinase